MSRVLIENAKSVLRLIRFLFWYGIAVAGMFYLLPLAGALVESRYDELSGAAKLYSIIGFFGVVGAWQALAMRSRSKDRLRRREHDQASLS